jgi:hypothetical protein
LQLRERLNRYFQRRQDGNGNTNRGDVQQ